MLYGRLVLRFLQYRSTGTNGLEIYPLIRFRRRVSHNSRIHSRADLYLLDCVAVRYSHRDLLPQLLCLRIFTIPGTKKGPPLIVDVAWIPDFLDFPFLLRLSI